MPFSILDVDVHPIHDQTTSWVNNARFSSFDSNQNNDQSASLRPYIENHQPLTTPNGSMVGSSDDHKVCHLWLTESVITEIIHLTTITSHSIDKTWPRCVNFQWNRMKMTVSIYLRFTCKTYFKFSLDLFQQAKAIHGVLRRLDAMWRQGDCVVLVSWKINYYFLLNLFVKQTNSRIFEPQRCWSGALTAQYHSRVANFKGLILHLTFPLTLLLLFSAISIIKTANSSMARMAFGCGVRISSWQQKTCPLSTVWCSSCRKWVKLTFSSVFLPLNF